MQKGLLYNMLLRLGKCFFLFPLFFIACDDLEDKPSIVPESNGDVFETGTAEMYILSEGLFNQNIRIIVRSLVILSIGKDVRTTTLVQTISGDWEIQPMT